jgi:putative flavoprotein involved in K+ transport
VAGSGDVEVGTVVVGAGQAGLATGYHLARRSQDFVVIEASDRVGASWRQRWDSLQLFTPAGFTRLPGMPFPADPDEYPGKDAVADYLESYARHFALPVELGSPVTDVRRSAEHFLVTVGGRSRRARNVVLAPGAHGTPYVPAAAQQLDPGIVQLHSRDYRRPGQLAPGPVLVVGAGNSGAEIALDVARDPAVRRPVSLAGRDVGVTPQLGRRTFPLFQRLGRPGAFLVRRALRGGADPLGRVRPADFAAAGVERLPRVAGARDGLPLLDDGRTVQPATVVWCTGLRPDLGWLHLDVFDAAGRLRHRGGVVPDEPGLYAVGLPYQRSITSHLVGGVGADARRVVDHLGAR